MADLSKIKVGDLLLVPVKATWVDDAFGAPVKVAFETIEFWLDRDTVSAVEHIPAPRVFKRGDWVSWKDGSVTQMVVRDLGDTVWVTSSDPTKNILWRKQDCEPTEAPE